MLELAKEWGLHIHDGMAYGIYCGCVLTVLPGQAQCHLSITTRLPSQVRWSGLGRKERQDLGIRSLRWEGFALTAVFSDDETLPQRVQAFLERCTPELLALGAATAECCPICGNAVMGRHPWFLVGSAACHLHPECAVALERGNRRRKKAFLAPGNLKKSLLGGSLGGMVGVLLWLALVIGKIPPVLAAPALPWLVYLGWVWGEGAQGMARVWGVLALSAGSVLAAAGLAWLVEPQGLWLGLGLGLLPVSMVPLFLGTYRQWKTIHLVPRRLT